MKRCNAFLQSISPKINIIVQVDFKLTYFEAAVQHFRHYNMETPTLIFISEIIEVGHLM